MSLQGLEQWLSRPTNCEMGSDPYTGNTDVNAVKFLCFLPLRVHIKLSSARTNSLFHSQMCQKVPGLHQVHRNPPVLRHT